MGLSLCLSLPSKANQRGYLSALENGEKEPGVNVLLAIRKEFGRFGDGAEWIWNLVAEHFPGAIQIVDLYHARQHLWAVARQLYPQEEVQQKAWMKVHQKRLLDKGKIEKLVGALRAIYAGNPAMDQKIRTEADYFARNAERMRYPKFRRQTLVCWLGCD
jgi:transcriptional regulator with XRE-family HTH domain